MAQTFSKATFSQDLAGNGFALGTSKTAIHRSGTDINKAGEIWLYVSNYGTAAQVVTIGWCDTSAGGTGGSAIKASIPASSGPVLVIPGLILRGNTPELWINAQSSGTSALVVYGYVNKIVSTNGFSY